MDEELAVRWIEKYEKQSKALFKMQPQEQIAYRPDKGFIGFIVNQDYKTLVITKMCGDGSFWCQGVVDALDGLGWDKLYYTTYRDVRAFCKLIGGKLSRAVPVGDRVLFHIESSRDAAAAAIRRRYKCLE